MKIRITDRQKMLVEKEFHVCVFRPVYAELAVCAVQLLL